MGVSASETPLRRSGWQGRALGPEPGPDAPRALGTVGKTRLVGEMMGLGTAAPIVAIRDPFTPVDVAMLHENAMLDCDLYRRIPGREYVLFLSKKSPLASDLWTSVRDSRVRQLYVIRDESSALVPYVLGRLESTLSDSRTPIEERSSVTLQTAAFILDNVMDVACADAIEGLRTVVTSTLRLAAEDHAALHALLTLTRGDRYTGNHSLNVGVWGMALAVMWRGTLPPAEAQQSEEWLASLTHGLFLHDIGKLMIPEEVLNYPGKYEPQHWAIMKQHPELGVKVLQEAGFVDPVVYTVVLQHHERNDGRGYPRGLQAEGIAFEAKVCTVADVFDALTTRRIYREPCTAFQALGIMIDEMRQEFDPMLFETFIRLFDAFTWAGGPERRTSGSAAGGTA